MVLLIRNLPKNIKKEVKEELYKINRIYYLEKELDFYKSIFKTHRNSAVFNLKIKTIRGNRIWYDKVADRMNVLYLLDIDEEVLEWLKPIRCER